MSGSLIGHIYKIVNEYFFNFYSQYLRLSFRQIYGRKNLYPTLAEISSFNKKINSKN